MEIVSSYRLLLFAHNSAGFDSRVVLNSLVKEVTELKLIKNARGLISLSIRCGVKTVQLKCLNTENSHILNLMKGSLEKIARE